jgi:hypothetical protein
MPSSATATASLADTLNQSLNGAQRFGQAISVAKKAAGGEPAPTSPSPPSPTITSNDPSSICRAAPTPQAQATCQNIVNDAQTAATNATTPAQKQDATAMAVTAAFSSVDMSLEQTAALINLGL